MGERQVLLVDDQHEVRRMLRSTLEVAIRDLTVVDVPSAEEAMLEVQRTAFDLVVTDLDLPGINGIELITRVRRSRPDARLIVITGNTEAPGSAELRELNPDALFIKPINPGEFVETVQRALGLAADEGGPPPVQPGVNERVLALRRDLGAAAIYLTDADGRIVVRAGDVPHLDVESMILHIEAAFNAGFRVSTMLGGYVPLNMLFFDGDEYDVYVANVGKSFMLLMIFRGERGRQQMGSALHYGRQAADDLLNLLAQMGVPPAGEPTPAPAARAATPDRVEEEPRPEPVEAAGPYDDTIFEPVEIDFEVLEQVAATTEDVDVDSFWESALAETEAGGVDSHSISYEQALKLGLVPAEED